MQLGNKFKVKVRDPLITFEIVELFVSILHSQPTLFHLMLVQRINKFIYLDNSAAKLLEHSVCVRGSEKNEKKEARSESKSKFDLNANKNFAAFSQRDEIQVEKGWKRFKV